MILIGKIADKENKKTVASLSKINYVYGRFIVWFIDC